VDKIKNVLKVGQDVTVRVLKIDKADRRIALSIKASNYSTEQVKEELKRLDQLQPEFGEAGETPSPSEQEKF